MRAKQSTGAIHPRKKEWYVKVWHERLNAQLKREREKRDKENEESGK